MAKASRPSVKTVIINNSRDIVVDKLLKRCEDGAHSKCTGWAVLKKEISPIDANYFLKCTCACHNKKEQAHARKLKKAKKSVARKVKSKAKKKPKRKSRLAKRSKKKSRKTRRR
jgi:hypothetical protein